MPLKRLDPVVFASPLGVVDASYDIISFEPDSEPNWQQFRRLFLEHARLELRLFPTDESISSMSVDEYERHQVTAAMKKKGYSETSIYRTCFEFGEIAQAQVAFQIRYGAGPPYNAVDFFNLRRVQGQWFIAGILGEIPRAGIKWTGPLIPANAMV